MNLRRQNIKGSSDQQDFLEDAFKQDSQGRPR